jgi:hypothetical protein
MGFVHRISLEQDAYRDPRHVSPPATPRKHHVHTPPSIRPNQKPFDAPPFLRLNLVPMPNTTALVDIAFRAARGTVVAGGTVITTTMTFTGTGTTGGAGCDGETV